MQAIRIILLLAVFGASGCRKDADNTNNNGLAGKWLLVEIYDGYVNGGSFSWHPVAAANAYRLEFTDTGGYTRTDNSNPVCSGSYQLNADSTLLITSSCQTVTERARLTLSSSTNIILDYQGIEGVVRYKFKAVP